MRKKLTFNHELAESDPVYKKNVERFQKMTDEAKFPHDLYYAELVYYKAEEQRLRDKYTKMTGKILDHAP